MVKATHTPCLSDTSLNHLTPHQREVVCSLSDHLVTVVSANAGSGKTFTTVEALLYLIRTERATVDQCILITFTRRAAQELYAKVQEALEDRAYDDTQSREAREIWRVQLERLPGAFIGTIHSFCREVLRRHGYAVGISRQAEMSTTALPLRQAVDKAISKQLKGSRGSALYGVDGVLEHYELHDLVRDIYLEIRNRGLDVKAICKRTIAQDSTAAGYAYREEAARLVGNASVLYKRYKESEQVWDSSDLLDKAAALLEKDPSIAAELGKPYRYLFIDEFQDTNVQQKDIAEALLVHLDGTLFVGDTKQSIYEWRGADTSLIREVAHTYTSDVILPLHISYRSSRYLQAAQNALFKSLADVIQTSNPLLASDFRSEQQSPTPPFLPQEGPAPFTYLHAALHEDNRDAYRAALPARLAITAEWIQKQLGLPITIKQKGQAKTVELTEGHIVILARKNEQVDEYVKGLKDLGLPVRAERGAPFFQQPEIVSTYLMLRLLQHERDDTVLSRALETPYFRAIDRHALLEKEHTLIQHRVENEHLTPLEDWMLSRYVRSPGDQEPGLWHQVQMLRTNVLTDTVPQLLSRLYEAFNILDYYDEIDQRARFNLERLREYARSLATSEQTLSLRVFLDNLEREIHQDNPLDESDPDDDLVPPHIRVMTVHRAKGLEFPVVIIPEVQANLVQSFNPLFLVDPNHGLEVNLYRFTGKSTVSRWYWNTIDRRRGYLIEEELRIFYVAVTRAQNAVVFVGSGARAPNAYPGSRPSRDDFFSWRDVLYHAASSLRSARQELSDQLRREGFKNNVPVLVESVKGYKTT